MAARNPTRSRGAAKIGQAFGYDEINLNIGCPSPRVRKGRFGAALMETLPIWWRSAQQPCLIRAVDVPVTVKCRIGIDGRGDYEDLKAFVETVAAAGVKSFAVHARIAVLDGLSPAENREIPPLRYDAVYRLKQELPALEVVINGGVGSLDEADAHLDQVDGAMIGRAAYADPRHAARRRPPHLRRTGVRRAEPARHRPRDATLTRAACARTAYRSTTSPGTCSGSLRASPAGEPGAVR